MSGIFDFFINLKIHEIVLWGLVILLLIWEFIIQRKKRKPLEQEIANLKAKFMKLGFTTELTKRDVKGIYEKLKLNEQEILEMKKEAADLSESGQYSPLTNKPMEIRNQHLFVLKVLGCTERKQALADFVMVYYMKVFKNAEEKQYRETISQLLEHDLIDIKNVDGKTYMNITRKGMEYVEVIEGLAV